MSAAEMVDALAQSFAQQENWVWNKLDETEDTAFGWSRRHIRGHVRSILMSGLGIVVSDIDKGTRI